MSGEGLEERPDRRNGHPEPADLERFLRCGLGRVERRAVVRHLLTGCPQCVAVTRRFWNLADPVYALRILLEQGLARLTNSLGTEGGAMTEIEAAAQAVLQQIVQELDDIRAQLEAMHERLPVPPEETAMLIGEEEMDVATEIRSVIECVLSDSLQPAIRDLAAAASYRPKEKRS